MKGETMTLEEKRAVADSFDAIGGTLDGQPARVYAHREPFAQIMHFGTPAWAKVEISWPALARRVASGAIHF